LLGHREPSVSKLLATGTICRRCELHAGPGDALAVVSSIPGRDRRMTFHRGLLLGCASGKKESGNPDK
jgi:hypothetical protein